MDYFHAKQMQKNVFLIHRFDPADHVPTNDEDDNTISNDEVCGYPPSQEDMDMERYYEEKEGGR